MSGIRSESFAAGMLIYAAARANGSDPGDALLLSLFGGAVTNESPGLQRLVRQIPTVLGEVAEAMKKVEQLQGAPEVLTLPAHEDDEVDNLVGALAGIRQANPANFDEAITRLLKQNGPKGGPRRRK